MAREYLIVIPVEPIRLGGEYRHPLPLHCTVMPWFRLHAMNWEYRLNQVIEQAAEKAHDIELVSDRHAVIGENHNTSVHLIDRNVRLNKLHTRLLISLAQMQCLPDEGSMLRSIGANYRAHVSDVGGSTFPPGTRHRTIEIVLVRRDEDRIKRVISSFPIK